MVQAKQKHPEAKESNTTRNKGQKDAKTIAQEGQSSARSQEEYLWNRVDQLGSILAKGLDLAETGITVGINLLNRLGSAVGERVIGRGDNVGNIYAPQSQQVPPNEPGRGTMPFYQNAAEPMRAEPMSEADSPPIPTYVVNRLPLFPGSPAQVSFSVSNDSPSSPKKVRLRIEGFVGEMHGTELDSSIFSVKPATKTIAPMDFDKFMLTGTIPQDIVADVYNGWIVALEGQEEVRIPVRLIVTA